MTIKMRRVIPLDRVEALAMARRHPGMPGICRECGCSQFNACVGDEGSCAWADRTQSLCNASSCVTKANGPEKMRGMA